MGESSLCISPRASVASFVLFKLHKCLNCCIYFRLEALRGHLRSLPLQKRKGQGHCPRYVLLLVHVVYNLFMYLSLHLIAHRVVRWSVTGAVVLVLPSFVTLSTSMLTVSVCSSDVVLPSSQLFPSSESISVINRSVIESVTLSDRPPVS